MTASSIPQSPAVCADGELLRVAVGAASDCDVLGRWLDGAALSNACAAKCNQRAAIRAERCAGLYAAAARYARAGDGRRAWRALCLGAVADGRLYMALLTLSTAARLVPQCPHTETCASRYAWECKRRALGVCDALGLVAGVLAPWVMAGIWATSAMARPSEIAWRETLQHDGVRWTTHGARVLARMSAVCNG